MLVHCQPVPPHALPLASSRVPPHSAGYMMVASPRTREYRGIEGFFTQRARSPGPLELSQSKSCYRSPTIQAVTFPQVRPDNELDEVTSSIAGDQTVSVGRGAADTLLDDPSPHSDHAWKTEKANQMDDSALNGFQDPSVVCSRPNLCLDCGTSTMNAGARQQSIQNRLYSISNEDLGQPRPEYTKRSEASSALTTVTGIIENTDLPPHAIAVPNPIRLQPKMQLEASLFDIPRKPISPTTRFHSVLRSRYTTGSKIQVSFADERDHVSVSDLSVPHTHVGLDVSESSTSAMDNPSDSLRSISRFAFQERTENINRPFIQIQREPGTDLDVGVSESFDIASPLERRMSEKALQDARQRIMDEILFADDTPDEPHRTDDGRSDVTPSSDIARRLAHTQSLAALEGQRQNSRSTSAEISTGKRPSARRGHSHDVSIRYGDRLLEEDESGLEQDSLHGSILRRASATGKMYILKRSSSPVPCRISPTVPRSDVPVRSSVPVATGPALQPKSETFEAPTKPIDFRRPMNMRNHSMIELSLSRHLPLLSRSESLNSSAHSEPLQVLEIHESGLPSTRYVSRSRCFFVLIVVSN